MNAPAPANEARRASTTIEMADDVTPLLVLLLLFVDGVGDGELVEEELLGGGGVVDELLGGRGVVDELLEMDEETLGRLAVGPPLLEVVKVGGMEVLPPRLHLGLPAESRKQVYPGARSGVEQGRPGRCEDGKHTAAKVLSSAHNVSRILALRSVDASASFTVRAASGHTVDRSAVKSSKNSEESAQKGGSV